MESRNGRRVMLGALFASASVLASPAAAESGIGGGLSGLPAMIVGQALSDDQLAGTRAAAMRSSVQIVMIQTGNGDETSTTLFEMGTGTPGSVSVSSPGSMASATTSIGHYSFSVSRTLSVSRSYRAGY